MTTPDDLSAQRSPDADGTHAIRAAAARLGQRRHAPPRDPEAIRRAFETGAYPYTTRLTEKDCLARSGIRLFKYRFSVTREEQARRFGARETDPLKQCKLSLIEKASLDKWDDYSEAKEAMFFYTDTGDAPWTVVKSDDKKRARIEAMHHFLSHLPYEGRDERVVHEPDPLIVGSTAHVIGNSRHILGSALHPEQRRGKGGA